MYFSDGILAEFVIEVLILAKSHPENVTNITLLGNLVLYATDICLNITKIIPLCLKKLKQDSEVKFDVTTQIVEK